MPETISTPSENDERKLWFEYVKTINERALQRAVRSGITTYVLLATLIALLYRFGPQIPRFVSEQGNVRAGIGIFALLEVVVSSFVMSVAAVYMFSAGESEFRATPKSSEAMIPVKFAAFTVVIATLTTFEVWIAVSMFSAMRLAKYVLLADAAYLALNAVTPIVLHRQGLKKAKDIKNPVPRFGVVLTMPRPPRGAHLMNSALGLTWSVLGAVSLIGYLKRLPGYGLQPLKAASLSLIALAIVGYMILRSIKNALQQKFFALERDIVLNKMTAAEIRERYLRDLSGPDIAQWLDESLVSLERKEERLEQEFGPAQTGLKEISAISEDYQAERKHRATLILEKLKKALLECVDQYDLLLFQSDFFRESYRTSEEDEALAKRVKAIRERYDKFKVTAGEATKLLEQLGEIAK